jgi:hypothetical protein
MPKKPDLAAAMKKVAALPEVGETKSQKEPSKTVESTKSDVPPSRVGKKAITGFFDPAVSRQLKIIGLEEDKSVQAMLAEALNDYFEKHGKNPIA